MLKTLKMTLYIIVTVLIIATVSIALFLNLSPEFGAKSKGKYKNRIEQSPNFKDGIFHNIKEVKVMKEMDPKNIVKFFKSDENTVPEWEIPVLKYREAAVSDSSSRLTWFGHSSVYLEIEGKKLFIDPMLGESPSPVKFMGPKRFNPELPLSAEEVPQLDAVIISHDHYDHLDYETIKILKEKTGMFYVPLGVGAHLRSWGVEEEKIIEADWWDEFNFKGLKFVSVPAQHFSGRGLNDRYTSLWCSWVIKGEHSNIFFGGDSGYHEQFKEIGEKYGPFDYTMIECGQYNTQWPYIHIMPEDAVKAHLDLRGKVLMPIHWGAFKLALHEWTDPADRIYKAAKDLNIELNTPKIGESIDIKGELKTDKWWLKN